MERMNCARCDVAMVAGFTADAYAHAVHPRWCEGKPEGMGLLSEVKRHQIAAGLKITTFRCPKCGSLESYAAGPPER